MSIHVHQPSAFQFNEARSSCLAASPRLSFPDELLTFSLPVLFFLFSAARLSFVCFNSAPGQSTDRLWFDLFPVALFGRIKHGLPALCIYIRTANARLTFHGAHPSGPEHHTLSPSHQLQPLQLPASVRQLLPALRLCLVPLGESVHCGPSSEQGTSGEKKQLASLCKGRFAANHSRLPASPNAVVVLFPTMRSAEKLLCSVSPGS